MIRTVKTNISKAAKQLKCTPHIRKTMGRRNFLKGAGVCLALPFLDVMRPSVYGAYKNKQAAPRRMVTITNSLGLLPQYFFPKESGSDYKSTPYLDILAAHRKQMTVISGSSLPGVDGAHTSLVSFLTGAAHPTMPGFRNTISLDVFAAEKIGQYTRFPFLPIMISPSNVGAERGEPISFTTAGVPIPPETKAARLYSKMFLQGNKREVQQQITRLREERSILDMTLKQIKKMNRNVGTEDKVRLDQYYTSIRELEKRLIATEAWEKKPKPKVKSPMPKDIAAFDEGIKQHTPVFDIIKLALSTDSTRIISLGIHLGAVRQNIDGVNDGTHQLTHHGNDPEKIKQLCLIEELQLEEIARFLNELKAVNEGEGSLLDNTMLMFGSNLGEASSHKTENLPIFLAGGGFKHGQHLAFDTKNNYPLTNLYVSMLQGLGIEVDSFSSSTGTMSGLDAV